jgi:hypothetical protein
MIAEKSRKRRPRGEWFWEAMVAACGNHCCAPGCMKVGLLEQGHIEPFGDGAHDNSENLIPLCRTCNFKYAKLKTPDGRPEGWRESFFILLANELRPRFIVRHDISSCATIAPCESAENKDVLVWPKPDFRSGNGVLPRSDATRKAAYDLVEEGKRASQQTQPAPKLPNENRGLKLIKLAEGDPKGFLPTCQEFLRRGDFMRDEDHVYDDSWGPLCANYQTYRRWAQERRERLTLERRATEIEKRTTKFFSILSVPIDWDGLSADEKAWHGHVENRRAAVGDVSADEAERSHDVLQRYEQAATERHEAEVRITRKRDALFTRYNRMGEDPLLLVNSYGTQGDFSARIEEFKELYENSCLDVWYGIRRATTIDELQKVASKLDELIAEYKAWCKADSITC